MINYRRCGLLLQRGREVICHLNTEAYLNLLIYLYYLYKSIEHDTEDIRTAVRAVFASSELI